jgi:hypothetical protein
MAKRITIGFGGKTGFRRWFLEKLPSIAITYLRFYRGNVTAVTLFVDFYDFFKELQGEGIGVDE